MLIKLGVRSLVRYRHKHIVSFLMIALGYTSLVLVAAHRHRADNHMTTSMAFHNRKGHVSVYRSDGYLKHFSNPEQYLLDPAEIDQVRDLVAQMPKVEMAGEYLIRPGLLDTGCRSIPVIATGVDQTIEDKIRTHPTVRRWTPLIYRRTVDSRLSSSSPDVVPLTITPLMSRMIDKPKTGSLGEFGVYPEDCEDEATLADLRKNSEVQLLFKDVERDIGVIDGVVVSHEQTGVQFYEEVAVKLPIDDLREVSGLEGATHIALYLHDREQIDNVVASLTENFSGQGLKLEAHAITGKKANLLYFGIMRWLWAVEYFLYILLGSMIVMFTGNFVAASIAERSGEIGTLRTVGFTSRFIQMLFISETGVLAVAAVTFGSIVAESTIALVNRSDIIYHPPQVPGFVNFELASTLPIHLERGFVVLAVTLTCAAVVTWWQSTRLNIAHQSLVI